MLGPIMRKAHGWCLVVGLYLVALPANVLYCSVGNAGRLSSIFPRTSDLNPVVTGLVRRCPRPVSSIEGAVWLLERDRISEEKRRKSVGIIRTESHQLNRALGGMLQFTQPRMPRLQELNHSLSTG